MIGDTAKLKASAVNMFEQYKDKTDVSNETKIGVINMLVTHLINIKEYLLAQEMLEEGLSVAPQNFDLINQMAYRYYNEAADYEELREKELNKKPRNTVGAEAARLKMNEILETSLIWAEKAYNINGEDKQHNIMYRRIMVRLGKPVSEELQKKVDSYYQQN
jgi:hypothetical protein